MAGEQKGKEVQNINVVDKFKWLKTREIIMARNKKIYGVLTTGKKLGKE